jgi:Flp pilus assembly protein TadG
MKHWIKQAREHRGSRKGSAMIEFAIGSSILIAVFTGTFQFGYMFYQYNTLVNAIEQAARYGSLLQYSSTSTTPTSAYTTAVQNMAVYGTPTTGTTPLLTGLSTGNVGVTITAGPGTNFTPAAVTVTLSSFTLDGFFGTQSLTNKPSVTYTYLGLYQP